MQRHIRRICGASMVSVMVAHSAIARQAVAADKTVSAAAIEAMLARPVTVVLNHVPVQRAIHLVMQQVGVQPVYQAEVFHGVTRDVTARLERIPLSVALDRVLSGTGLHAVAMAQGYVRIEAGASPANATGTITGRVLDASTKRPLPGATVLLDNATRGVTTDDEGGFRLVGLSAGSHQVAVRLIGHVRQAKTVMVSDDQTVTMEFTLEPSATALDQVVVTGTIIPTELKAVPNAITVITAKQIEERGITHIDQLFRGDVPGLFAQNSGSNPSALLGEVTMFSRGATRLNKTDPLPPNNFNAYTNPIKTYVDGVELADPKYLSQIDPKSIERIEILTGPQASTIYGSNAINGVMQIFTKRGTSNTPQLSLNLLSGWVENNFSSARTPQHDYSTRLSGVSGQISYNVGGSWNYMGPWTPATQSTRTDGFGGAKLDFLTPAGRVSTDFTFRHGLTQSLQRGALYQTETGYGETGWYTPVVANGRNRPTTYTLTGQTLGLILSYVPTSWWSHELEIGQDVSDTEQRVTARAYTSPDDTTLFLQGNHTDRRSVRYATTLRLPVTSLAQLDITAGGDAWQDLTSSWNASPQTLTGYLDGDNSIYQRPDHNAGGFLQSQLGLKDQLFFTYGLRAEWNPGYGADAQPNLTPRFGVAFTQDVGPVTAKVRGSFGRSTRPPATGFRAERTITDVFNSASWALILPYWGNIDSQSANPELMPEHQQGGEGGLELYFGTLGSLVATRYNQTVDGLIDKVRIDSVRSLVPCNTFVPACVGTTPGPDGYSYWPLRQYLNIGSIRNQGWELQGSVNTGPFTTRGTYSWTKSRVIGVNPKYRSFFTIAKGYAQYQPGATFQLLPEHTWALGVAYAHAASNVGLNITGTGRVANQLNDFYSQYMSSSIRLQQNRFSVTGGGRYIQFNTPYALTDLNVSHRFGTRVEGVLQVQNLMNHYTNDLSADYATLGRQTKLGIRVRT